MPSSHDGPCPYPPPRKHSALAHGLSPVQVGGEGVSEGVLEAGWRCEIMSSSRCASVPATRGSEAGTLLAEGSGAALCQVIGRVVVLYRRRGRRGRKPRIELP